MTKDDLANWIAATIYYWEPRRLNHVQFAEGPANTKEKENNL